MPLQCGDLVHVITRRRFEDDVRRHFVGQVADVADGIARIVGYAFVLDPMRNEFARRPEERTRIFGLGDAGHVINVLPPDVQVGDVRYEYSAERRLILTDGSSFQLDVQEFGML